MSDNARSEGGKIEQSQLEGTNDRRSFIQSDLIQLISLIAEQIVEELARKDHSSEGTS